MKKVNLIALAAIAGLFFVACNNSSNSESDGAVDTLMQDTMDMDTTTIGQRIDHGINELDKEGEKAKSDIDAATNEAKADVKTTGENIKTDVDAAKDDIGDAAKAAGKDIKNAANKVADKTKEGYNDAKESLKKDKK